MSVTFTAPDGGDPTRYAMKAFNDAIAVPERRLLRLGENLAEKIRIRTADGESYNGSSFAPYNTNYAERKGSSEVDLYGAHEDDGHMMDDLEVRVKTEPPLIEIGFFTRAGKASLAQIHNEGSHLTVGGHVRGGINIASFLRRRPIRGIKVKGGRMIFDKRSITETTTEHYTVKKNKAFLVNVMRRGQVGPARGAFKAPPSVVAANQRVFVRTKRNMTVWHEMLEHRTREVTKIVGINKVSMYRIPIKAVIPARPFLGLTIEDQEFVARNIVQPQREGGN